MYDPRMVAPMRQELTDAGFEELLTAEDVDRWMADKAGTGFLVMNSVCGCAAGNARPAAVAAVQGELRPDRIATVFAGQYPEATAQARGHMPEVPPSSPSMYLFKDGELVHLIPRHRIENRLAQDIARELAEAFQEHCSARSAS